MQYRLFLIAPLLALGACATAAQRGAERQIRHDLNSMEAEQRDILAAEREAARRCPSGKAEHLPGKGGWTPEEYRCVPPR